MIELLFFASEFQCGANAELLNIQVGVYHNQELVQTMSKGDTALLEVDSVKDLTFTYTPVGNATCSFADPSEKVLAPNDALPPMAGVYEQQSIQAMQGDLKEYEELLLVELGTTNNTSAAYDLQDVVIKVNNNPPTLAQLFAD